MKRMLGNSSRLENSMVSQWLELSNLGAVVIERTNHILLINTLAGQLMGVNSIDCLNSNASTLWRNVLNADELQIWVDSLMRNAEVEDSIENKKQVTFLARVSKSDSSTTTLLFTGKTFIFSANMHCIVISIANISDVHEKQKKLSFDLIHKTKAANAAVLLINTRKPNLLITHVNSAFEVMMEFKAEELIGKKCTVLLGKYIAQHGLRELLKALKEKRNGYANLLLVRKNGQEIICQVFVSPVFGADGQCNQYLGVINEQIDHGL